MSRSGKAGIIIVAAGVVILAVAAVLYFTVINKKKLSGPEQTVVKYFDALSSGNMEAANALFTAESKPSGKLEDMVFSVFGNGMIKWKDVKTELVSDTGTEAEVKLADATIEMMGQSVKLSEAGALFGGIVFKLKNVNGQWLIENQNNPFNMPEMPQMPQMPQIPNSLNI